MVVSQPCVSVSVRIRIQKKIFLLSLKAYLINCFVSLIFTEIEKKLFRFELWCVLWPLLLVLILVSQFLQLSKGRFLLVVSSSYNHSKRKLSLVEIHNNIIYLMKKINIFYVYRTYITNVYRRIRTYLKVTQLVYGKWNAHLCMYDIMTSIMSEYNLRKLSVYVYLYPN